MPKLFFLFFFLGLNHFGLGYAGYLESSIFNISIFFIKDNSTLDQVSHFMIFFEKTKGFL